MKRILSLLLALSLCAGLSACLPGNKVPDTVVSDSGAVEFTSSSSGELLPPSPESPAAVESGAPSSEAPAVSESSSDAARPDTAGQDTPEVRAVWVSYLELGTLLTNRSAEEYRKSMAEVMETCADFGLNTVILQVRPFGDAIYPSQYFPQSYLFDGTEGQVGEAPFDALAIALEEAHKRNLRLEAWINPYRVRNKADEELSTSNPANALLKSRDAVRMGEAITYNPASEKAQKLIVDGVVELLKNYDVDGIHFDDYFYPTTDEAFDAKEYSDFKASSGDSLASLADWRRGNVTELVRKVRDAIQQEKPSVLFGISPQGNLSNNINVQYVDVEEIVKNNLVDYICPQMYFGYQNSGCPYQSTIEAFNKMTEGTQVAVYAGLASYKFNKIDTWAGEGKSEWVGTTDLLRRQVESARDLSGYGGFVLYRYDSSFVPQRFYAGDTVAQTQIKTEMETLKQLF